MTQKFTSNSGAMPVINVPPPKAFLLIRLSY